MLIQMRKIDYDKLAIVGRKCINGVKRLREAAEAQAVHKPSSDSHSINPPHSEAITAHTRPLDSMADYISRGSQFTIDRCLVKCRKEI